MNRKRPSARLTRVYLEAALVPETVVELPADAAMHLAKVLRAHAGDPVILFNGDGREFDASIQAIRGSRVTAEVGQGREVDRESPLSVTLVQCVPRGDRMDFIVQKATELGVGRIVPVMSQRSVVRLDGTQAQSKAAHWRGVALSACEQCGRARVPQVDLPQQLLGYLGESSSAGSRLVFEPEFERGDGALHVGAAAEIAIGPEGGFAADELEAFRVAKFSAVTLGPRILRTETAAIAAIAWLQTRFGDMRGF